MPSIKIATAQSRVSSDVRKNGIEIRRLIKKAKAQGANLVHFTEGALSGYTKEQLESPERIDFKQIKIEIQNIKNLCKKDSIWAAFGCAHKLSGDKRPHNSIYIISDQGDIVNRYDKRKCSNNEILNWYTPGFSQCTFTIDSMKFGCILCIEINFPELFIEAEREGIECLLFSSYSKNEMFGIQAQGHAASHNYWISMSVPANNSHIAPSQFIAPGGKIQARCKRNCSSIIISDIDTEDERWHVPLKLARPWRRLAKKGDIYEDIRQRDMFSADKTAF